MGKETSTMIADELVSGYQNLAKKGFNGERARILFSPRHTTMLARQKMACQLLLRQTSILDREKTSAF